MEEPQRYIVRIAWDSLDGHLNGFWTSAAFPQFLDLVRPYLNAVEEMQHYEATGVCSTNA